MSKSGFDIQSGNGSGSDDKNKSREDECSSHSSFEDSEPEEKRPTISNPKRISIM